MEDLAKVVIDGDDGGGFAGDFPDAELEATEAVGAGVGAFARDDGGGFPTKEGEEGVVWGGAGDEGEADKCHRCEEQEGGGAAVHGARMDGGAESSNSEDGAVGWRADVGLLWVLG